MWRMPIALQRVAQAKVMQTGKGANHGGPSRNSDEEEWFIKVRIVSFVVTASLILAFVFLVSTPPGLTRPTLQQLRRRMSCPLRQRRQLRPNRIRRFAKRWVPCAARRNTWNAPPTISAGIAWKP